MLMNIFTEDSKFWYYFAMNSCPIGNAAGCPLKEINIMKELSTADIVLLIGNISTLDRFPFGVADYYYNNVSQPEIMEAVQKNIKENLLWTAKLNVQKNLSKASLDEIIKTEANRVCRDKKTFTIRAANGKFVCAGGNEDKVLIVNRDVASDWETFSSLNLGDDKVVIYSYKNRFLSAELGSKAEITSTRTNIGGWEIFVLQNLGDDFVAFKASNGKYLSLDEKTQQLFANADKIGANEKFKITVVK